MKKLSFLMLLLTSFALHGQDFSVVSQLEDRIPRVHSLETPDGGRISVGTTKRFEKRESEILLTKNNAVGNEEWYRLLGGSSYEKASAIGKTRDGGYIIVGSTSSYGNGNYDILLIKTDEKGKEKWKKTYGGFYNEYGYAVIQTRDGGYLIEGKKQFCKEHNDWGNCSDEAWRIKTDAKGNELWSEIVL